MKCSPGRTSLWRPRVPFDGAVWHLDVGSSHPGAGAGPKGMAVRHLKRYVSWVSNVGRQFGPYLPWVFQTCEALSPVREDREGRTSGVPVVAPAAPLGS